MTARRPPLRAGVIAAGRGERLSTGGAGLKPLVEVNGRPLIAHVLASIADAGAREVAIIVNEESTAVRDRVGGMTWPFAIRWLVETTPSSMHSFLRIVEVLAAEGDAGPFLISTVDTVAPAGAFARFVADAAESGDADVTLALTDLVDDDKPLRVRLDGMRVIGFGGDAAEAPYVTAGYYLVAPSVLAEAERARRAGLAALRAFLACLLEAGYGVRGVRVPASIDVDRLPDVAAAEALLRGDRG